MKKKAFLLLPLMILILPLVYSSQSVPIYSDDSESLYSLHHNHFEDPQSHATIDYPNIVSDDLKLQDTINFEILNQITSIQQSIPTYTHINYQVTTQSDLTFSIAFTVDYNPYSTLSFDINHILTKKPENIDT